MVGMYSMDELVDLFARQGIQELLFELGRPPIAVSQGRRRFLDAPLVNTSNATELLRSLTTEEQRLELEQKGALDFTHTRPNRSPLQVRAVWHGGSLTLELRPLGVVVVRE